MGYGKSPDCMAMGAVRGGLAAQPERAPPKLPESDFDEISLVDIVRVLHRRRAALAISVVLALVAGGAITFFTTPEYEAEATVIPLEHTVIIRNWLQSRQAAEFAVESVGRPLLPVLFPGEWDAAAESWSGVPRSPSEVSLALLEQVTVTGGTTSGANANPTLTVTVALPDAQVAADVAGAYLSSLDTLRPELENITRSTLFDRYYDGTNAQEAQSRAERAAREKSYWIVFDQPSVPEDPVRPRPVLNMALATVLGVMGGVLVVFGLEWVSRYKAEFTRVEPPLGP